MGWQGERRREGESSASRGSVANAPCQAVLRAAEDSPCSSPPIHLCCTGEHVFDLGSSLRSLRPFCDGDGAGELWLTRQMSPLFSPQTLCRIASIEGGRGQERADEDREGTKEGIAASGGAGGSAEGRRPGFAPGAMLCLASFNI